MNGRPHLADLLADAFSRLRRPMVPTAVAVLIVFTGTLALFGTTGIALASQQRTLERMNSPQGRLITVTDAQGNAGLSPASVQAIATLTGVEWVAGIGPATDITNANIPQAFAVPARAFYGELPTAIRATGGFTEGQAIVGPGIAAALGLADGVGAVSNRTQTAVVVGSFVAADPLTALNQNVLVRTQPGSGRLLTLWVSATDISQLAGLTDAVRATVIAQQTSTLRIETSGELAQLRQEVLTEMARTAQLTITGLLVIVGLLLSAVQFGRVAAMAKDIGRRRALGASRNSILLQVLLNAALCALIGIALGITGGLALTFLLAGAHPPLSFTVGVGILMTLAALTGTLPPAIRAARLDPVRILRVP